MSDPQPPTTTPQSRETRQPSKTPKIDKIEQKLVNKSEAYWRLMRGNISLLNRSEKVNEGVVSRLREELSDILDLGIIIYPQTLTELGVTEEQSYKEKKQVLGIPDSDLDHTPDQLKFLHDMSHKADRMRAANWTWRISQEAEEMEQKGWYPFFVTLTVDPKKMDAEKMWKEGREFRRYITSLTTLVCKEMGHKPAHKKPYRPQSDYVRYAGVLEHGKSRMHHHAHFIIWFREIPDSWKQCPNAGIGNPAARIKNECRELSVMWKHASHDPKTGRYLAPALYFRTLGDVYQRLGFKVPMKNGAPMPLSTARVAGKYITKYLSKDTKEWHHRMKATRNLGKLKLREVIRTLNYDQVKALTWRAHSAKVNTSLLLTHTVPLGLLRLEAKRRLFLLDFRLGQLDLIKLMRSNTGIFSRMLGSVAAGVRPDRMDSADYFDWVGGLLPVDPEYSEFKLIAAHCKLIDHFPRPRAVPRRVSIPGQ